MQVKRLRQVYLVSPDLEARVKFYGKVLGLRQQFRDGDRWVQFQAGEVSLALASQAEGMGAPRDTPIPVFEVTDVDQARTELEQLGYAVTSVRDMGAHGRMTGASDPGGAYLVLLEPAKVRANTAEVG